MLLSEERTVCAVTSSAVIQPLWKVDVVNTLDAFLDLEDAWNALVDCATVDHPFCTFNWMRSWWESFGRRRELHVLVARQGSRVGAIAPLMLSRGRLFGVPVRRLESMANEQTPRFDFIVARDAQGAYAAIWRFLQREAARWDVLRIAQLPEDGPTVTGLTPHIDQKKWPVGRWDGDASPYLTFETEDSAYERTVGRKHRTNVTRLLRRLWERGTVELEIVEGADAVDAALNDGLRLEASGWKHDQGTAILCQPHVAQFYRSIAARFAAAGQLQLVFLKADDRRIAFAYGLRRGAAFYMVKCGYDPAYSRFAPVHVLCHLLFRDGHLNGSVVDFLGGNDEWKQRWTHRTKRHVWLYVFRDAWWTRLLCRTKFSLVPHLKQQAAARAIMSVLRDRTERRGSEQLQPNEG